MTPKRQIRIDELATKLKHCQSECDELYNDEDGQRHLLQSSRRNIAADLCGLNLTKINRAEENIKIAIAALEGINN